VADTEKDYRQHLTQTYEELSVGYGRTLVTLAGGALAISMAFVKDMIGSNEGTAGRGFLILAWVCWTISLCSVLSGYYFGREAARYAIGQYDRDELRAENGKRPGGPWAVAVNLLGILALVAFTLGVISFLVFVYGAWGIGS